MRKYIPLALVILILASTFVSAAQWKFDESKVHFYLYGMATCPHCQRMKKLIPETYGYDKFTYYELIGNDHNGQLLSKIAQMTGITGVPTIGIVYNGTLVAVIEGEFNVSATPDIVRVAFENNGTLLFVGGRTYLLPWNNTEAAKAVGELKEYFLSGEPEPLTTTSPQKSTTTTTHHSTTTASESPGGEGKKEICGPALVVAVALLPLALVRRKR